MVAVRRKITWSEYVILPILPLVSLRNVLIRYLPVAACSELGMNQKLSLVSLQFVSKRR